jgi:hypothetical protein
VILLLAFIRHETNYEISETTRTEVQAPGAVKRLSVAVAVDGVTAPGKDGKPGPYTARSAQEMQQIEQLVRSAVGYNQQRGDQVTVVNVRFPTSADPEGVTAASPLMGFDKNDIMRAAAGEMRTWLEHLNMNEEIAKVLTKLVVEVKTEIRFRPTEDGKIVPETTNDFRVKPGTGGG